MLEAKQKFQKCFHLLHEMYNNEDQMMIYFVIYVHGFGLQPHPRQRLLNIAPVKGK
jgi:hypothetical protein